MRSVSIVASGFLKQAEGVAHGLGAQNLALAEYPGVIMVDSKEELRKKVEDVLLENIVRGLTSPVKAEKKTAEPEPRDVVFKGTLGEVQDFFYDNLWTEGLPIIPPTIEEIEKFLRFTDRSPDEVLGALLPENREATIWNVAVNGVMAGCKPEYMPILIAVVEAIADPEFRIEDSGSTPGWEPLIILNGPIIKDLDFNYGSGVMRVGKRANTSIGRFLRLYMRNIAGMRITPSGTDKGSIAQTFNVVLAENEDAVTQIGWQPFSVDRGFKAGDNV
ncbi:MAG: UGSC family (seleno)protein, partial [Chloroflexota bacterium]